MKPLILWAQFYFQVFYNLIVSSYCLTSNKQFISYIMARANYILMR